MTSRNKRSFSAFVAWLLVGVAARDERIVVSQSEGVITSPSFDECAAVHNKTIVTWEFPVSDNLLYLNIEQLLISKCHTVTLYIIEENKQTAFCKRDKQLYDVYATPVRVRFKTNSDYCKDSFRVRFAFISSDIEVAPGRYVAVNQKVTYKAVLSRLPMTTISPTCVFYFGDGTQSEKWETPRNELSYTFAFPGLYNYRSVCQIMDVTLTSKGFVKVEANMTYPSLNLWYTKIPLTFQGDVELRFDHIYTNPIYYYLSVQKSVFVIKRVEKFDKSKFIGKTAEVVLFGLKKIAQKRLGPGLHPFTLSMENNVSCLRLESDFTLNHPLEGMRVVVAQFVGIHPHQFNINVTFGNGAPADISITIVERSTEHAVTSLRTICKKDCKFLQIKASVPKPAVDYMVKATAENFVSSAKAEYGPFAATPYVYDLYVTSQGNLKVGSDNTVLVFIRADLGEYTLSVISGEEQEHISFNVKKLSYDRKIDFNFPADVRKFTSIAFKFKFKRIGFVEITSVVANIRRSVTFKRSLRIFGEKTCDCTVRIRDGNKLRWTEHPLKIESETILTSDAMSPCEEDVYLRFKWDVFRVESNEQPPLEINKEIFHADTTQPDVILDPRRLPHGLYVMQLVVTTYDVRSNLAVGAAKDFTLFENRKRTIEFVIKGGRVREIGANEKVIDFDTSLSSSKRFYIQWFCARAIDDLPYDIELGKLTRKGSCFGWDSTLYLAGTRTLKMPTANLTKGEHFHLRAFAWRSGYERGFADQEIVLLSNPAPKMTLRCFSNCDQLLFPQLPLILQLDCSNCRRYRWMLRHNENTRNMEACENNEFCKIDENLLQKLSPSKSSSLTVRGSNNFGSSIVTLYLTHKPTPSGGKCIVSPPAAIAYSTKFSVVCSGFHDKNNGSLIYKFFLLDRERQNPLLQHGFDHALEDVILSPSSTYKATFLIKICNVMKSCAVAHVSTYVAPRNVPHDYVNHFHVALKSRNLQRMVQAMTSFPDRFVSKESTINHAIKMLSVIKLSSVEGVKQTCDVLNYVTANAKLINKDSMNTLWASLTRIQQFLHNHLQHDDITFLVQSCASTASNVIQTRHLNATLREKMSRFAAFGNFIMTSVMPKERPATFSKDGMTASFLRLHKHGETTSRMPLVTIRKLDAIRTGDVINIEVHKYDAAIMNFDTARRRVDDVTSVFITSGLNHPKPISSKNARDLQSSFILPPGKIVPSKMNFYIFSVHNNETSQVYAKGSNYVTVTIERGENLQGAMFKVGILNPGLEVDHLSVVLQGKDDPSFTMTTQFNKNAPFYDWLFPVQNLLPSTSTYKLTIHANLSLNFDANFDAIKLKIFIYLVNCLYWDDVIADWNHDECKPISNATSASMTCECYRFPVINPKRGPDGTSKEDLLPTLFATKLVMFPSRTINLTCVQGLHNPLPLVVVLLVAAISLLMCKWAQRKDKKERKKDDVIEVIDNSPFETYRYLVTTYTGWGSGTTAGVSIRLVGSKSKSKVHVIQAGESAVLKRGSVVSFLITTEHRLGEIKSVRVWRDNNGSSPEWSLSRMAVKDLEQDQCWFFLCNRRLRTTSEYIFPSSSSDQLHEDGNLFSIKWKNYILDRHLWWSALWMRSWEVEELSRVQRLALHFLDIFLVMLPATYLHYHSMEGPEEHCRDTMNFAIIGGLSGVISFPLLCLYSALFRIRFKRKRKTTPKVQKFSSSLDDPPPGDSRYEDFKKHHEPPNEAAKEEPATPGTAPPKPHKAPSSVEEEGLDKGESCEVGHKKKRKKKEGEEKPNSFHDQEVKTSHLEAFSDGKPPSLDAVPECEGTTKEPLTIQEECADSKLGLSTVNDSICKNARWKSKANKKWDSGSNLTNDSTTTQAQFRVDSQSFTIDSSKSALTTAMSSTSTIMERSQAQTTDKLSRWALKPYLNSDCVKSILRAPTSKTHSVDSSWKNAPESFKTFTKPKKMNQWNKKKSDSGTTSSEYFFPPKIQWKKRREEVMRLSLSQSSCDAAMSDAKTMISDDASTPEDQVLQNSNRFITPPSMPVTDSVPLSNSPTTKSKTDATSSRSGSGNFRRRLPSKPTTLSLPKSKRSTRLSKDASRKSLEASVGTKEKESRKRSVEKTHDKDLHDLEEQPSGGSREAFITAAALDASPSDIDNFLKSNSSSQVKRQLPARPGSSHSEFAMRQTPRLTRKVKTASNGDSSSDSSDNCLSESHWETINENLKLRPRIRKDIAFCYNRAQTFKTIRTRPRDRSSSGKKGTESSVASKSVTFPGFSSEYDSFVAHNDNQNTNSAPSGKQSPTLASTVTKGGSNRKQRHCDDTKPDLRNEKLMRKAVRSQELNDISIAPRAKSPDRISEDLEQKMEDNERNLRKLYLLRKLHARKKRFQKKPSPCPSDRESDEKRNKSGSVLTKQITKKRKFVSEDTYKKLSMSPDEVIEYWLKNTPNYYKLNSLSCTPPSSVEVVCSDLSLNSFYTADATETDKSSLSAFPSDMKLYPSAGHDQASRKGRSHSSSRLSSCSSQKTQLSIRSLKPIEKRKGFSLMDPTPDKEQYTPKPLLFTLWLALISLGLFCCIVTILHGMAFEFIKSLKWLASVTIGYVETFLILETLFVTIHASVMAVLQPITNPRDWLPLLREPGQWKTLP